MRFVLFLSRIAFICGIFFLLALSLLYKNWTHDEDISSTIILIGYLFGLVIVPAVNLIYLFQLIFKGKVSVPAWLAFSNFINLLILITYILFQNGTLHY